MGFFISDDGNSGVTFGDIFGADCNGHLRIRISDYASIDGVTGEMHMNSRWKKKEKKEKLGIIKVNDDEEW